MLKTIKKIILFTLLAPMLANAAKQFGTIECRTPYGAVITAAALKNTSNNTIWYAVAIPSTANYGDEFNEYKNDGHPNATWTEYMTYRFNNYNGIGKRVITSNDELPNGYELGGFRPFASQPDSNNYNYDGAKNTILITIMSEDHSIRKNEYDKHYFARAAFKAAGINYDEISQLSQQEQMVNMFKEIKSGIKNNSNGSNQDDCIVM